MSGSADSARRRLTAALALGLTAALVAGAPAASALPSRPQASDTGASTNTPASATPSSSPPPAPTTEPVPTTPAPTTPAPTTTAPTTTAPTPAQTTPVPPPSTATNTTSTSTRPQTASSSPGTTDPRPSAPPPPVAPYPGAVPPPFSDAIAGAGPGKEALAAEAMRLSQLVVDTRDQLAQLEVGAEAASDAYRQAASELADAEAVADRARAGANEADVELRRAQDALGVFARNSYIGGNQLASDLMLLDARSPSQLVERAGLLESVANSRTTALALVISLQATRDNADAVANDAVRQLTDAERTARSALDLASTTLSASQAQLTGLLAQQTSYDKEFYDALVTLLGKGEADALIKQYQLADARAAAAAAAARRSAYGAGPVLSGRWALPLAGTLTSCYCLRWGTMHWGIDIAAPMYTPIYAAGDGTVLRAGEATGFGQAVYIQHDNGDVTVYGHMEVIEVTAGQRVVAGQEIAQVGTRGFSTGPHLHFEVQSGGIGGTRVDPVIWLANRGIFV